MNSPNSRFKCVRCDEPIKPGELYAEVHRAEERDGATVITRGVPQHIAHLSCPPRCNCPSNGFCSKCRDRKDANKVRYC